MSNREKIELTLDDFEELRPMPALNLEDLKEIRCLVPKDKNAQYMVYECEPAERHAHGCPGCGSIDFVRYGTTPRPRLVHDVSVGAIRVDLLITVPRYKCKDCDTVFSHEFDCAPGGRHLTYRLAEQLRGEIFDNTFTKIADKYGFSEGTIRRIFEEFADIEEENRGPIVAPTVLGIDEKHIRHKMRGVFVDIESGELLEMTQANRREDIIGTIERMIDYDRNIKIVTTDMANNYRSYIAECLPGVKQVIDKYHVYQDIYRRIATTKTSIMAYLAKKIKEEPDRALAAHWTNVRNLAAKQPYLFKFSRTTLSEKDSRIITMAEICATFPEFNHLRLIKEKFEEIYAAESRADAEAVFEYWKGLVPPTGTKKVSTWEQKFGVPAALFTEFQAFSKTITKWKVEIFNYFDKDCRHTNAAAEGLNSFIQRINSEGAGYGFKVLRAKALHRNRVTRTIYTLKSPTRPGGWSSGTNIGLAFSQNTTSGIVCVSPPEKLAPVSMDSFVEYVSDYYDFCDDEE